MLTLYTREQGKLRAVAKGARRLRSRKAGHLQPFTRVALLLARGHDIWIVNQAETVDAYLPLRENLLCVGYASYVIELLDRFTYEEEQMTALYTLLVDTLERLSQGEDFFLVVRYYEIHLLNLMGFRPELVHCVGCQTLIKPEAQYFSNSMGGILCPRCGKTGVDSGAQPVAMDTLRYMRHFQRSNFSEAQRARNIQPAIQTEMEAILQGYLIYVLERNLKTPAFLRAVKG